MQKRKLKSHLESQHYNEWYGYVKLVVCKQCQDFGERCTCEASLDVPMMAENDFLSAVAGKLNLTFTNPTPTEDDAKLGMPTKEVKDGGHGRANVTFFVIFGLVDFGDILNLKDIKRRVRSAGGEV